MSVFTLYQVDDSNRLRIIKSKQPNNPYIIVVNDDATYDIYDNRIIKTSLAIDYTFWGFPIIHKNLSRIDYAKRVVRSLYKKHLRSLDG